MINFCSRSSFYDGLRLLTYVHSQIDGAEALEDILVVENWKRGHVFRTIQLRLILLHLNQHFIMKFVQDSLVVIWAERWALRRLKIVLFELNTYWYVKTESIIFIDFNRIFDKIAFTMVSHLYQATFANWLQTRQLDRDIIKLSRFIGWIFKINLVILPITMTWFAIQAVIVPWRHLSFDWNIFGFV